MTPENQPRPISADEGGGGSSITITQLTETETRNSKPGSAAVPAAGGQDARAPKPPSPDARLMLRIKTQWGAAIREACRYSSIPEEFLAALIANESGGDPAAKRFEKSVYNKFQNVLRGYVSNYANLSKGDLGPLGDAAVRDLATSWGLTQVMGYHVARRPGGIELLKNPETHLKFALGLLAEFADLYQLNVKLEFAELFRCWNTGRPYGQTFDPKYVDRGIARAAAYAAMLKGEL